MSSLKSSWKLDVISIAGLHFEYIIDKSIRSTLPSLLPSPLDWRPGDGLALGEGLGDPEGVILGEGLGEAVDIPLTNIES